LSGARLIHAAVYGRTGPGILPVFLPGPDASDLATVTHHTGELSILRGPGFRWLSEEDSWGDVRYLPY